MSHLPAYADLTPVFPYREYKAHPWSMESVGERFIAWCAANAPDRHVPVILTFNAAPKAMRGAQPGSVRESYEMLEGWFRDGVLVAWEPDDCPWVGEEHLYNWVHSRLWGVVPPTWLWAAHPQVRAGVFGSQVATLKAHPWVASLTVRTVVPSKTQGFERVEFDPADELSEVFLLIQWLSQQVASGFNRGEIEVLEQPSHRRVGFRVGDAVRWSAFISSKMHQDRPWDEVAGMTFDLLQGLWQTPTGRVALARGRCPWT